MGNDFASAISASKALIQADATRIASAVSQPAGGSGASGFAGAMRDAIHGVNAMQHEASARMEAVNSGQSDDLVGAMLASQEASLSFSMLMQVRNKVVGAVEDLIKLPL